MWFDSSGLKIKERFFSKPREFQWKVIFHFKCWKCTTETHAGLENKTLTQAQGGKSACCSPRGRRESGHAWPMNWTELNRHKSGRVKWLPEMNTNIFKIVKLSNLSIFTSKWAKKTIRSWRVNEKEQILQNQNHISNFLLAHRGWTDLEIFLVGAEEPRTPCKCFAGGTFPAQFTLQNLLNLIPVFLVLITFHLYTNYYPPHKN